MTTIEQGAKISQHQISQLDGLLRGHAVSWAMYLEVPKEVAYDTSGLTLPCSRVTITYDGTNRLLRICSGGKGTHLTTIALTGLSSEFAECLTCRLLQLSRR